MPYQNRVWLEQEDHTVKMSASPTHHIQEFRGEDGQYEFLPPGNARWTRLLALQDMQLLLQKQDLEIFLVVRVSPYGKEGKQQGEDPSKGKVDHTADMHGLCRATSPTSNTFIDMSKRLRGSYPNL